MATARAASIAMTIGKMTYVIYTLFPTAPRILGSRHDIFVFFTLDVYLVLCSDFVICVIIFSSYLEQYTVRCII